MKDIETKIISILGEPSTPDVFSTITPVRDSITDALQEVCMLTGSLSRTYHVDLQEDQYVYDLEMTRDYFGYILRAWDRNNQWELEKTDVKTLLKEDPFWFSQTGNQYKYFQIGFSQVGFWYVPSSSGNVIELQVACVPQPYTDDDDPIRLQGNWEDLLVNYALSEQLAARGDATRAGEYYKLYLEGLGIYELHPDYAERVYEMKGKPWQRSQNR